MSQLMACNYNSSPVKDVNHLAPNISSWQQSEEPQCTTEAWESNHSHVKQYFAIIYSRLRGLTSKHKKLPAVSSQLLGVLGRFFWWFGEGFVWFFSWKW